MPKTTVLVVEDDSALRVLHWTSLTAAGYRVAAFEDGLDALHDMEGSGAADVVVLDLDLPRVYAVLRRLWRDVGPQGRWNRQPDDVRETPANATTLKGCV